jgi:hypothetical protein
MLLILHQSNPLPLRSIFFFFFEKKVVKETVD